MNKVYFLFGVHNHQPVGNFDYVFKDAFERCYSPFIDILEKYPLVKCNLHISGPLYDWIILNQKYFIEKIRSMTKKGQLEIISGGYYEPILPIIPDEDKISQIRVMNQFIKKHFGIKPEGIWIAERVWEPYLARIIHNASLRYTFLDDTHFRFAGLMGKEFFGYYATEDAGKEIFVFPISKTLRYKIPFSRPEEAVQILKGFSQEKDVLITLFDDGEKFGLWPHTFEWVYTKGWLDNFFRLLSENTEAITTVTAHEAIERFTPEGLIYLPTASYEEMGEWVLNAEAFRSYEKLKKYVTERGEDKRWVYFLKGGFFRNFCSKYTRINFMHKKMVFLSNKIHSHKGFKNLKRVLNPLWQAQCNCGYWHGIFGGFYLGHIRSAIYENLIIAEKELDKSISKKFPAIERCDFNFDGYDETVLKNQHFILTLSDKGASIIELSCKDKCFNLLNTITRGEESYHRKIKGNIKKETKEISTIHDIVTTKEDGLDTYLIYDDYDKVALVDHLLSKDISIDDYMKQKKIKTLSNDKYNFSLRKKRDNFFLDYHYRKEGLEFSKKVVFGKDSLFTSDYKFFEYSLLKDYYFGIEFNLFLPSQDSISFIVDGYSCIFDGNKHFTNVGQCIVKDSFLGITIHFDLTPSDVFILPLYSVSSSESGFEKVYQQTTIVFIKKTSHNFYKLTCALKREVGNV